MWVIAMFQVSHYVWIKSDDAKKIVVVGPNVVGNVLMALSNRATNRKPTLEELDTLRLAIFFSSVSF